MTSFHPLPHRVTAPRPGTASNSRTSGFTLYEVLLAGSLAAMLVTALAYATMQFAMGVTHLEQKAGISDPEETALRMLTRDIRQAWWAEVPDDETLHLADTEGNVTEYFRDGNLLKVRRPNGDEGTIYAGLTDLSIMAQTTDRNREGPPDLYDTAWYTQTNVVSTAVALQVESGGVLALAFQTPVDDGDVPGFSDGGEQVLSLSPAVVNVPIAFVPGTAAEGVSISLYESRAPGSAVPYGDALDSLTVEGSSLPLAEADGSGYEPPSATTAISLSGFASSLVPGRGYTLLFAPTGDAEAVFKARTAFPNSLSDDVAVKDPIPGSSYVKLPLVVPYSLSGPFSITTTVDTPVVSSVSITIVPDIRPSQTRSASLLSQTVVEDPWYGVVPGETAD